MPQNPRKILHDVLESLENPKEFRKYPWKSIFEHGRTDPQCCGKFCPQKAQRHGEVTELIWIVTEINFWKSAKLLIGNCFRINYVKVTDTDTDRKWFRN